MTTTDTAEAHVAAILTTGQFIVDAAHNTQDYIAITEAEQGVSTIIDHANALGQRVAEVEQQVAFDRRPFRSDAGVRGQVIRELAAWARQQKIPDSEGGWDIRYDVSDWLMQQLPDDNDGGDQEDND